MRGDSQPFVVGNLFPFPRLLLLLPDVLPGGVGLFWVFSHGFLESGGATLAVFTELESVS